jgi:hypothetical protein
LRNVPSILNNSATWNQSRTIVSNDTILLSLGFESTRPTEATTQPTAIPVLFLAPPPSKTSQEHSTIAHESSGGVTQTTAVGLTQAGASTENEVVVSYENIHLPVLETEESLEADALNGLLEGLFVDLDFSLPK